MLVKDIIAKLKTLDPNIEAICYFEGELPKVKGAGFILFDVVDISKKDAVRHRIDGTPYLAFDNSNGGTMQPQALIEITADF